MANVLIVEDDKDLNFAYTLILKNQGHKVTSAYNGQEALDKLTVFRPQLILLDLLMPVMGGLEFLQHYKNQADSNAKVMIFTNIETSADVAKTYKLGADKVIVKSWTAPHNLAKIVDEALRQQPKTTAASAKV